MERGDLAGASEPVLGRHRRAEQRWCRRGEGCGVTVEHRFIGLTLPNCPAPPPLDEGLDQLLRRMRLPHMRRLAPEVLATAKAQRWDPPRSCGRCRPRTSPASGTGPALLRLFELYDVKPRQRAAADLHETSGVMQSAKVDGRESHRVGKR